jgi:hypothetical protein
MPSPTTHDLSIRSADDPEVIIGGLSTGRRDENAPSARLRERLARSSPVAPTFRQRTNRSM